MPTIKTQVQYGLLFLSWIACFYLITFLTQLTFTPWDGAIDWPAIGTWQRTLNDFFASDPGRLVISVPVLLFNGYGTLMILRRQPHQLSRLLRLWWVFILLSLVIWYAAVFLNNALHPYPPVSYDPNYRGLHLTIIPGAALIGFCILWSLRWIKPMTRRQMVVV